MYDREKITEEEGPVFDDPRKELERLQRELLAAEEQEEGEEGSEGEAPGGSAD